MEDLRKGKLGLIRVEKLDELRKRYEELCSHVNKINDLMKELGGSFYIQKVLDEIDMIFRTFSEKEFIDKKDYIKFVNDIKDIEAKCDLIDKEFAFIGGDFASFSVFEFIVLAQDLLEIATYDSLICPDYPCTSEIIYNGKFSYWNVGDEEHEIIIDSPDKCWEYLKESYDSLED